MGQLPAWAEPDLPKTLQRFAELFELNMVSIAGPVLPSRAELEQLLRAPARGQGLPVSCSGRWRRTDAP